MISTDDDSLLFLSPAGQEVIDIAKWLFLNYLPDPSAENRITERECMDVCILALRMFRLLSYRREW